jgi:broad specificity phosphatase PhoE
MDAIFFRHASRESPLREASLLADGGLSARGRQEADILASHIANLMGPLPVAAQIICSPKRRARETVEPLAAALGLTPRATPGLDERGDLEPARHFEARVQAIVGELHSSRSASETTLICSHLDWLEKAMLFLPSDMSEVESSLPYACAEPRLFRWRDGLWRLEPFAQNGPSKTQRD